MDGDFYGVDRHAINGKFSPPERHVDVLVVGAGAAGCAAAIEAAKAGATVLLVDENPVSAALMGLDTPLYYGGRMTNAVQNQGRMLEQVFNADPALQAAFEAGVDVALATYAWGVFVNGPGVQSLPSPVVGLADEERSWTCGFTSLILATGARDLALAFPGWDQPGVMGAGALRALMNHYDAFAGRRILFLGSGELALSTALLAIDRGVEVAALVEVLDQPQGPSDLVAQVKAHGVPILTSRVITGALGGIDGVHSATLAPVGGGAAQTIACDTVCQAIGMVPAIELLDAAGGKLVASSERGGFAPVLKDRTATSLANVFVAGACAGLSGQFDHYAYRMSWMRAVVAASDPSVIVCQCEGVTRADLLGVQPPAYLDRPPAMAARDIGGLLADGPVNQDQIKRLTRACMGACQARRCREQVALLLAMASQTPLADVPLAGFRAPVRPLPLKVLAAWDEPEAMGDGWDVWLGIAGQWTPYDDIGTEREALHPSVLGGGREG